MYLQNSSPQTSNLYEETTDFFISFGLRSYLIKTLLLHKNLYARKRHKISMYIVCSDVSVIHKSSISPIYTIPYSTEFATMRKIFAILLQHAMLLQQCCAIEDDSTL